MKPVRVTVGAGEPREFATPFGAVCWLMRHHCTPEQIQSLRLDVGRSILNTFEVKGDDHPGPTANGQHRPGA